MRQGGPAAHGRLCDLRSQAYPTGEQIVKALRPSFDAPVCGPHWVTSSRVVKGPRGRWSLDYFIRTPQQRRRDCQAERLGRLKVDNQLKGGRLLDRQFTRLRTLQQLVDVDGRTPPPLDHIGSVGQ